MSQVELNIRRWDPNILERNRLNGRAPKILVIGRSGSGKSTLVLDLLYYIRKIQSGVVICPTEASLIDYRLIFPESFIHESWDSKLIANFLKMQKRIRKKDPSFHQILMLDDIMYDKNAILKDESTRFVFMNGRNNNISMIITQQYCMDLTPDLRNNIDFVIALRDNVHANREKLWRNFFGVIPTSDAFHQVMQRCTTGFNAIVLDNTSRSANIDDCIFYYGADARMDPCRVLSVNPDNTYDVEFTEDHARVARVNRALVKKFDEHDSSPIRPGESIQAKFKRTWLTLPPHKRRCFHRTMWEFHEARFNPEHEEAEEQRTGAGAGAGAGSTADMFRKTRKNEKKLVIHTI